MGLTDGLSSSNLAGRGGASIYGKQFEDELHPDLKFTGKYVIWLCWVGERGSEFEKLTLGCDSGVMPDTMAGYHGAAQLRRHKEPWWV